MILNNLAFGFGGLALVIIWVLILVARLNAHQCKAHDRLDRTEHAPIMDPLD